MAWFLNHYICPRCKTPWSDEWSATCDDDCPKCGIRHISPTESKTLCDADCDCEESCESIEDHGVMMGQPELLI